MLRPELQRRIALASAVLVGGSAMAGYAYRSHPDRVAAAGEMSAKLKATEANHLVVSGRQIAEFADEYESTHDNRNDIVVESDMGGGYVDINILTSRDNVEYQIHAEMPAFSRINLNPDRTRAIWTDAITNFDDGHTEETTDTVSSTGGWMASSVGGVQTGNKYVTKFAISEPSDMQIQNELTGLSPNSFTTSQIHQAVKDAKKVIKDQSKTVSSALAGKN